MYLFLSWAGRHKITKAGDAWVLNLKVQLFPHCPKSLQVHVPWIILATGFCACVWTSTTLSVSLFDAHWKSLSAVHVVIGKVTMTLNNAFMLELMSMGQLSSTSTSFHSSRLPNNVDPGRQAADVFMMLYVFSWNWLFISEICASRSV